MLILLTFQHFYMTKSEAFASDFVDSLKHPKTGAFECADQIFFLMVKMFWLFS
jgi:hypothetical protein